MYGKGLGVVNTATGISLLPNTGDSRPLLVAAVSLLASGVIIFVAATVVARKNRHNEAN
jgi:LPXTG-motif cell wall-anchored protein